MAWHSALDTIPISTCCKTWGGSTVGSVDVYVWPNPITVIRVSSPSLMTRSKRNFAKVPLLDGVDNSINIWSWDRSRRVNDGFVCVLAIWMRSSEVLSNWLVYFPTTAYFNSVLEYEKSAISEMQCGYWIHRYNAVIFFLTFHNVPQSRQHWRQSEYLHRRYVRGHLPKQRSMENDLDYGHYHHWLFLVVVECFYIPSIPRNGVHFLLLQRQQRHYRRWLCWQPPSLLVVSVFVASFSYCWRQASSSCRV